jgi:hypothetical protein
VTVYLVPSRLAGSVRSRRDPHLHLLAFVTHGQATVRLPQLVPGNYTAAVGSQGAFAVLESDHFVVTRSNTDSAWGVVLTVGVLLAGITVAAWFRWIRPRGSGTKPTDR